MKKIPDFRLLLIVLFSSWSPGVHAQLPCDFSWDSVVVGNNQLNFTTPAASQPYQGPCMAFAFSSAIEMMYRIEHNSTTLPISLNEAYLDYLVYDWDPILPANALSTIADGGCGNFPANCNDEEECLMWGKVNPIISGGNCFEITRTYVEYDPQGNPFFDWIYAVVQTSTAGVNWFSVGQFDQGLSFSSTNDLKSRIINNGPVILRVQNEGDPTNPNNPVNPFIDVVGRFRNYAEHPSFHGYVVLGWKEVPGGVQWLLKDSWPAAAGFHYSKTNPGIVDLINDGRVTAYQVSGIAKNGQLGDTSPYFSHAAQCKPKLAVDIHCWGYGADKGGCASVSGGNPPYTYRWQLAGSGGYFIPTTENCIEIIGSQFNGTLYVTVTDGQGQTAWDSCSITPPSGGGGPTTF